MKCLLIDRDSMSSALMKAKLTDLGHEVVEEPAKNDALELAKKEEFECIFFDPAPLTEPRQAVLEMRRSVRGYPYMVLLSREEETVQAIRSGCNDVLSKPLDPEILVGKTANAERMNMLIRRIGDEAEDFPSAGGVIAKSAFNQLFLSAIDRADRYGEMSYLLFISLENYRDLLEKDGHYVADYAIARLSQALVRERRQSDIIAQTAKNEYTLMLQRPVYETEPVEAANRFAVALGDLRKIFTEDVPEAHLRIFLIDLPTGTVHVEHKIAT